MWMLQGGMGWWMVFGVILFIIFWGGIIALIVWGVRSVARGGHHETYHESRNNALDILKERYAKGEITKEQYEQMKKDLS